MTKIKITNSNADSITVEADGEEFILDKDTVSIQNHPDTRKSTLVLAGFCNGESKSFEFLLSAVALPVSPASKAALISTVNSYISGNPEMQVFTPLTGVTIAPVASKARRLVVIVKPAGTIAANTVTMPAMNDGQILTLISTQTITSWTITPNGTSTIQNAPTAGTTTFTRSWIYNAAQDTLFLV
jgi:hypothetical protein